MYMYVCMCVHTYIHTYMTYYIHTINHTYIHTCTTGIYEKVQNTKWSSKYISLHQINVIEKVPSTRLLRGISQQKKYILCTC
jgi:hypothetical protein